MDLPLLRIKKPENTEAERARLEKKRIENLKAKQAKYARRRKILQEGKELLFINENNSNNNNSNENVWNVTNEEYLFNEPPFTPQNSYVVAKLPSAPRKQFTSTQNHSLPFSKRRLSYSNNSNNRQKRAKMNSKGGKRKTYRRRK